VKGWRIQRETIRIIDGTSSEEAEELVEAIEMALQNPLPHWGRGSTRSRGIAHGSGSAGFIEKSGPRSGSNRRIGGRGGGRHRTGVLIRKGLCQSRPTERESSQKVGRAFGMGVGCGIRGRLGEAGSNGRTGPPCVEGNWRFFVNVI